MKKRKIYEIIRMMLALVLVFAMTTTSFAATVPFTQISDEENLAIIEQKIKKLENVRQKQILQGRVMSWLSTH